MAMVKFLDGEYAGSSSTVDDKLLSGEGRYDFQERHIPSGARPGIPYFLKRVDPALWADPNVAEWTAAVEDDPAEDE